jgi:undecaprenyl-diphosphatase
MTVLEAILLGIIQGLTEFLPVSSSGHIELGKAILGVVPSDPLLFSVVVHAATALSTIVIFRKDVRDIFYGLVKMEKNESFNFSLYVVLSMIPAAIVGVFFNDFIELLFDSNLILVGSMLLVTAVLLLITDYKESGNKALSLSNTFVIGIAQAIAILPGISRSGATISTAVILGINRTQAARFSFLMVVPLILGKMAKDLIDAKIVLEAELILPLIAGFASAFLVGLLACKWMIALVKNAKLKYFAFYCIIVGATSLIFAIS